MALSDRHAKLLEARGLDVELLERLGIDSSDRLGGDCIALPFVENGTVVNHKFRTIAGEKRFSQDANARKCFWNFDAITDPTLAGQPLVITEGEFDAIAAIQCGFVRSVSVPDGAPASEIGDKESEKYSYVADAKGALADVKEIILCADADGPGVNLLNDLSLRLGRHRCKWVKYPKGCKDLNDALVKYGARGVTETINRAQWIRVDGVYRMSELPPVPEAKPHDVGIDELQHHYRVRLGDFAVVTGIPSHGKTTFVNELCCRLVDNYRWPIVFASFEQSPQVDHKRNLRTYFNRKRVIYQAPEEIERADAWIDENFIFVAPNEDDDVTLGWTLERIAAAVIRANARVVVIDPWNEMDHVRPPDMSLTEYTGFAIKQFRKFARKYRVHLIVVAHPTKIHKDKDGKLPVPSLYDISDSAHWYNKPEVGVVVHRIDKTRTLIRVCKSRYHDQIGTPGEIVGVFDIESGRYRIEPPEAWKPA